MKRGEGKINEMKEHGRGRKGMRGMEIKGNKGKNIEEKGMEGKSKGGKNKGK